MAIMGLLRRPGKDMPDDPYAPVLTRLVETSRPVTEAWWMPGAWIGLGNGCELAGLEYGAVADEDTLERLVTGSDGAVDVVVTEPIELIRALLTTGRDRDGKWFYALFRYAAELLPGVLDQRWREDGIPLDLGHVKLIGAVYAHPVSCCWPVDGDRYHAHVIVPAQVYCDDPDCTQRH